MALTGLEIYKLLPQTNCKECSFPTCLAFAMKLAAKQAELKACPYVSEESKTKLEAASSPPIRLVELVSEDGKVAVGNETVLFRHEKTFYHRPGLFLRLKDSLPVEEIKKQAAAADAYKADYVGIPLTLDGFAIEAVSGDPAAFAAAVKAVRAASKKPLILLASAPEVAKAGVEAAAGTRPLLHAANAGNWQAMAEIAKAAKVPLAARADTLDDLAALTQSLTQAGIEDLVLDPGVLGPKDSLEKLTTIRRLALQEELPAARLPDHHLPRRQREGRRGPAGGGTHRQVRRIDRPRVVRSGQPVRPARPAAEHLHRPAEADPGPTRVV